MGDASEEIARVKPVQRPRASVDETSGASRRGCDKSQAIASADTPSRVLHTSVKSSRDRAGDEAPDSAKREGQQPGTVAPAYRDILMNKAKGMRGELPVQRPYARP